MRAFLVSQEQFDKLSDGAIFKMILFVAGVIYSEATFLRRRRRLGLAISAISLHILAIYTLVWYTRLAHSNVIIEKFPILPLHVRWYASIRDSIAI